MLKLNPLILAGAQLLLDNSAIMSGTQFLIKSAFDSLTENLCPNMSLVEVAQKYSPKLKNIITQYQDSGAKYQAGKFKIICLDETSFALNFELYFTDSEEKWLKAEITSSTLSSKTWLSPEAWLDLRKNKEKIFSIKSSK